MLRNFLAAAIILLSSIGISAQTQNRPLLIGRVTINQTHIAFTYAGKIWLVERTGGVAKRLTTTPNDETSPLFSPDGKQIAFSRANRGDWDVFVMSADGQGEARRLTFQAEDEFVNAWTPDGREIVFGSTRHEEGVDRLHKVAVEGGGLETSLPLPHAYLASFSPDGKQIAYNPRLGFGEWRYYRGGSTAPIWITDLQSGATEKLPTQNYSDRSPMWIGDKIYFASDRTGTFNLFVHDRKTKKSNQLTRFEGQGVRSPTANGDAIVFVQDGRIHLYDLATNQDKVIDVAVSPDTSELLPRNANVVRFLEHVLLSTNGEKAVIGARGEVLMFDPKSGEYKNLTSTSGVAERYPTISPDNKSVAYFSDETGEYALHIRSLENDSVRKISIENQPSYYANLAWSPDSQKLVFVDRRLRLWLFDLASSVATAIDTSDYSAQSDWQAHFSPDSRYLAYAKRLKNRAGTVFIYDLAQKRSFQITDGKTHTESPVFDANGKYLYFLSSLNALTSEFDWGVLYGVLARPLVVRRVHALALSPEILSPTLPNGQPNPDAKVAEVASPMKIDFTGMEKRFIDLRLPPRDYARLSTGKPGQLFLNVGEWSKAPGDFSSPLQSSAVYLFDVARGGEMQKMVEDIRGFQVTGDGSRLFYVKGREWFLVNADTAPKADEGKLDPSKMEVRINPAEEWRQIFRESMRIMRDWFYDTNHHGQDLKALENYYASYLPTITRRSDLNSLMLRMLGSVSVSHLGVSGGDAPPPAGNENRTGLLGADYAIENGRFRFKKIYQSTSFAAAIGSFSAPLDQPGVAVREGDYLLEVNGTKLDVNKNLFSYFDNTAGRPTRITVSADASGTNPRTFTVYPAGGENRLRRANWAEKNRLLVEKLSAGRLGYIFIEDYGSNGIMGATNGLTASADKAGVIIDQRYNGGGITPDQFIEWLRRKPLYYYMFRGGVDIATPVNPAPPVKVMIINESNGSAAETGAMMFKLARVGALVGKRTYGGGIGPYFFTPRLIDGGSIRLPNRAAYNHDGSSWGIENIGVEPDYDVEVMPQDLMAGRDPQLEKAVEVALAQISRNPVVVPKRPTFPIHPGKQAMVASQGGIPMPGSAFPAPQPKPEVKAVTDGKFAEYLGRFDTAMGQVSFSQEGEKVIGLAGGERLELFPDGSEKDKFVAQTTSVSVKFMRDTGGKVTGVTIVLSNGREVKGTKVN